MADGKEATPVTKRLDTIIRMMLDHKKEEHEGLTTGNQLMFLETMGISSTDAAHILGINPHQLTSYRRRARKETKKETP